MEIAGTFPLTGVAKAHELSEAGHVRGKLILTVSRGLARLSICAAESHDGVEELLREGGAKSAGDFFSALLERHEIPDPWLAQMSGALAGSQAKAVKVSSHRSKRVSSRWMDGSFEASA